MCIIFIYYQKMTRSMCQVSLVDQYIEMFDMAAGIISKMEMQDILVTCVSFAA